ncbi:MAG: zf-HC2 domain-containing protein [Fuerstiella sp.]
MSDDQNWKACPEGTLSGVRNEQDRNENHPVMARRAALGVIVTAGAAAGYAVVGSSGSQVRELTCAAALEMAPAYLDDALEKDDLAALENHLADCQKCRPVFRHMQEQRNA